MPKVELYRPAAKFLQNLPPKQARQVASKITALREELAPESARRPSDVKPLKGYPYWRADVGEYRIIYHVAGDTLHVPLIGKRNDDEVYRRLHRL